MVKVLYISPDGWRRFYVITSYYICFNLLTANPTKWSNTLKQSFGNLPTNCLSMFDHFVKLALKGLRNYTIKFFIVLKSTLPWKTSSANKNSRFQQTFSCLKAIIESLEKDEKKNWNIENKDSRVTLPCRHRRPGRLVNVLCTFNLRPMSTRYCRRYSVLIVNLEHISHIGLVFILSVSKMYLFWAWT